MCHKANISVKSNNNYLCIGVRENVIRDFPFSAFQNYFSYTANQPVSMPLPIPDSTSAEPTFMLRVGHDSSTKVVVDCRRLGPPSKCEHIYYTCVLTYRRRCLYMYVYLRIQTYIRRKEQLF